MKLNFDRVSNAFCRELGLMTKNDFAKTYAFLFSLFMQEKKYPWWHRSIIFVINGFPFVSKRKAQINMINMLLQTIPEKNVSNILINSVGRMAGYNDILASVEFIKIETTHKISQHFMTTMVEFMDEVDEYIRQNSK